MTDREYSELIEDVSESAVLDLTDLWEAARAHRWAEVINLGKALSVKLQDISRLADSARAGWRQDGG